MVKKQNVSSHCLFLSHPHPPPLSPPSLSPFSSHLSILACIYAFTLRINPCTTFTTLETVHVVKQVPEIEELIIIPIIIGRHIPRIIFTVAAVITSRAYKLLWWCWLR